MIGLQWQPGKDRRGAKPSPVVISQGPSTSDVERASPVYDPFAAYRETPGPGDPLPTPEPVPPKRGRGRPRKVK